MRKCQFPRVLLAILLISLLLFSLSACQNSQVTTPKELPHAEQVMFVKADKVYVGDIDSTSTRKLFTAKYKDAVIGFAKYFVASKTVIYETARIADTRGIPELRRYSIDTGRDELIDTKVQVIAADDSGLVLYTKLTGAEQGRLWLYDIHSGKRSINITNAATGVLNKDNTELFHHSFVPPTGPIPEPQALYITNIKSGKQEMVVTEKPGNSVFAERITPDSAIYFEIQGEGGLGNVYSFDRATKKHLLIADNVLCFNSLQEQDSIVVARAVGDSFNILQVIEAALDGRSKRIISDVKLPDSSSGYRALLVPTSSTIILHAEANEFSLYNYKTHAFHPILGKNEAVTSIRISKDQKSSIVVINTTDRSPGKSGERLYKIDLISGKRSLIYEGPLPEGGTTQLQILDIFTKP